MSTKPPQPPIPPIPVASENSEDPTSLLVEDNTSDLIDLPSGSELDEVGAAALEASTRVRVIVAAGPVGCGKTTLITSLYELFQWNSVSEYSFAGSRTLPAFERRCYLSRTASERETADTERTPFGEVRYLHLRISKNGALDLLFTDVSGESFERARDSITECQHLSFLRQSDHFLLLLDSKKLIRKEKRWQVAHDSMALLRSCLDSGMLDDKSFVNIILTKVDYFAAAPEATKEDNERFIDKITAEFRSEFAARLGRLTFGRVAARPTSASGLKFGHGLAELLNDWASVSPRERSLSILPSGLGGSRESELFASRHFTQDQDV